MFDHVGFAYNSGETVLRDVSFTAKQGEVTALVGPSGGGKTTVSRLAARFWDYQKGSIIVGGMEVSRIDPEKLMSLYSIVFQDVTLFDNTILENIRLGRKGATDEEVLAAAKLANCEEFAEKLPDKWNTNIGENGCALSGGERQRISIARAFLKDGLSSCWTKPPPVWMWRTKQPFRKHCHDLSWIKRFSLLLTECALFPVQIRLWCSKMEQ